MIFQTKHYSLNLSRRTHIMGILNVTPDSFSDGGKFLSPEKAIDRALMMVEEGADIIDIGGESSQPGAVEVGEEEELKRVLPVISSLSGIIPVPISIDTYKPAVADAALKEGADIINDITSLKENSMADVVRKHDAGIILMHMKGNPANMQENPQYDHVIEDIKTALIKSVDIALTKGISREKIMIDPGIGFGKTVSHNLIILKNLSMFKNANTPILVGTSRKSFIGKILDLPPEKRLEGTAATVCASILNGANVVRVHDVKEMKRIAAVTDSIKFAEENGKFISRYSEYNSCHVERYS